MKYAICKSDCGSMTTKLYKNKKYEYEEITFEIKVFDDRTDKYVYFYPEQFYDYFYTKKEYRKAKLEKINENI